HGLSAGRDQWSASPEALFTPLGKPRGWTAGRDQVSASSEAFFHPPEEAPQLVGGEVHIVS
ncbi:MAG: hypothetical protein D6723_11340, partial [Acidobacteria bacterium]